MKRATQQTLVALTALLLAPLAVLHAADAPAVINLRQAPYSAAADGRTDDRPSLAAAFSAAKKGDTIFVPAGDYRIVLPQGTRLSMPEGVALVGEKGLSRFVLVSDGDGGSHRTFLLPGSSSVIQGIHFSKEGTFPAVLFPLLEERDGIVFRDCVFDGGSEKFPSPYCHCFQVGNGLPNPSGVLVKDNVLINGEKTMTWYLQPGSGPEPAGNIVVKPDGK